MNKRLRLLTLGAAAILMLAGCGGGETSSSLGGDSSSEEPSSSSTESGSSSSSSSEPPAPTTITLDVRNLAGDSASISTFEVRDAEGNAYDAEDEIAPGTAVTLYAAIPADSTSISYYWEGLYFHVGDTVYRATSEDVDSETNSISIAATLPSVAGPTAVALAYNGGYDSESGIHVQYDLPDGVTAYGYSTEDTYTQYFYLSLWRDSLNWTHDSFVITKTDSGEEIDLSQSLLWEDGTHVGIGNFYVPNGTGDVTITLTGSEKTRHTISYVNDDIVALATDYNSNDPLPLPTSSLAGESVYYSGYSYSATEGDGYLAGATIAVDGDDVPEDWYQSIYSGRGSFSFTMPDGDVTITFVEGTPISYTVTGTDNLDAYLVLSQSYVSSSAANEESLRAGGTYYIHIDPKDGYGPVALLVGDERIEPRSSYGAYPYYFQFTVPVDQEEALSLQILTGALHAVTYKIDDSNAGVRFNFTSGATYAEGASVSFSVRCNPTYEIVSVLASGIEFSYDSETGYYSFTMPARTVNIMVLTQLRPTFSVDFNIVLPEGVSDGASVLSSWTLANYNSNVSYSNATEGAGLDNTFSGFIAGTSTNVSATTVSGYSASLSYTVAGVETNVALSNVSEGVHSFASFNAAEGMVITLTISVATPNAVSFVYAEGSGLSADNVTYSFTVNDGAAKETLTVYNGDVFTISGTSTALVSGEVLTFEVKGPVNYNRHFDEYTVTGEGEITITVGKKVAYFYTYENTAKTGAFSHASASMYINESYVEEGDEITIGGTGYFYYANYEDQAVTYTVSVAGQVVLTLNAEPYGYGTSDEFNVTGNVHLSIAYAAA